MNTLNKYIFPIILTALIILLWLNILPEQRIIYRENTIKDTVIKVVNRPPVIIEKAKPVIKIVRDTIIKTKPFIASIDTVILHDTIKAEYSYPDNLFSFMLAKGPDTLYQERLIYLPTQVEKESKWWEVPVYILSGAAAGFIAGSINN